MEVRFSPGLRQREWWTPVPGTFYWHLETLTPLNELPFAVCRWVLGRSFRFSCWKLVRNIFFLQAACQLCPGLSWNMVLGETSLISLFELWGPAMNGCLWECSIHGTVLRAGVSFYFLLYYSAGRKGKKSFASCEWGLPWSEEKRTSQLLIMQLWNKYWVMEERDSAMVTNLKQFMMLSSDAHLCFWLNLQETFLQFVVHWKSLHSTGSYVNRAAPVTSLGRAQGHWERIAVMLMVWLSSHF